MERLPGWADIGRVLQEITPAGREPLLQELLTIFSLDTLLDSRFPQLSLGQQNRVNLVRYLVQDFDLLILDESLANVDEQLRQSILLYLKQRFPNKMFLSISHNLMEIATFCQQILVLSTHQQEKKNHLVRGLDLQQEPDQALVVNRKKLDAVMLEIMNVC
jgi:multiple sugar transport system ATP-binding protein